MSIQRFSIRKIDDGVTVAPDDNGPWVSAEAHEMEVRAAEQRVMAPLGRKDNKRLVDFAYDAGYREGLDKARDAVAGLSHWFSSVHGVEMVLYDDTLAAIDALRGESNG